jgi:hypothetical protein
MTLQEQTPTKIFICYSHNDAKWLGRLKIHLKPLVREQEIDVWDDTRIVPGSIWQEDIEESIRTAKVAILLISADFLASDFIATTELPSLLQAAEAKGLNIIPVIISPTDFQHHQRLSKFQAVNDPQRPLINLKKGEQESVWVKVIDSVKRSLVTSGESAEPQVSEQATHHTINNEPFKENNQLAPASSKHVPHNESQQENDRRIKAKQTNERENASYSTRKYKIIGIAIITSVAIVAITLLATYYWGNSQDPEQQVQIDKADVYLDLTSSWKELTEAERKGEMPLSKAILHVNFLARKYDEGAALSHRLGTSSALQQPFEWRSDPLHKIEAKQDARKCSPEVRLSYMLYFDIKDEPINAPFRLSYEIDFWNAHNGQTGDWHAFYVSKQTKMLVFKISFPKNKPYTGIKFLLAEGLECNSPFSDFNNPEVQEGIDENTGARTVTWTIRSPETHWIYRMQWTW